MSTLQAIYMMEENLQILMPNIDKMAVRQIACQLLTSQEFLALDKSMALNLRIQLTMKSYLESVARYVAINLLNVTQQGVRISPPQLNQPSLSSLLSPPSPVAVVDPLVHTNNNLGAGTGFLNQQQQISSGYGLISNRVVQVQASNQVLVGTTTATLPQKMPTNHRPTYPFDSSTRGHAGTSLSSLGQKNTCTSTSEEETSTSEDKDTSSNTADHPLHGLNCLAVASFLHSKKCGTVKEDGQEKKKRKKKKKEGDTKQVKVKKAGEPFKPFRWPPKDRAGHYILPKPGSSD